MIVKGMISIHGIGILLVFWALMPMVILHRSTSSFVNIQSEELSESSTDADLEESVGTNEELVVETKRDFLWNAEASPQVRNYNLRVAGQMNVTLVIAHCDKSLEWIPDYLSMDQHALKTTKRNVRVNAIEIFSKCGKPIVGLDAINMAFPQASMTTTILPNVGRCDHTYARWIRLNANATNVGPNDVVLFLKDNDHRKSLRGTLETVDFHHIMGTAITYGFACAESEKMIRLPRADKEHRYTSPYYAVALLRKFTMEIGDQEYDYVREKRDEKNSANFKSVYANAGEWMDDLALDIHKTALIPERTSKTPFTQACFGGMFAVTRANLRTSQNMSAWESIEKSLSRGDNIEEGHFCERTWAALFFQPLADKRLHQVVQMARRVSSPELHRWRVGRIMGIPVTDKSQPYRYQPG